MGRAWLRGKKASLMTVAQAAASAGVGKRKALRMARALAAKAEKKSK